METTVWRGMGYPWLASADCLGPAAATIAAETKGRNELDAAKLEARPAMRACARRAGSLTVTSWAIRALCGMTSFQRGGCSIRLSRQRRLHAGATSAGPEAVGPGDWRKLGPISLANGADLASPNVWHKWWTVMDLHRPNHAAKIDGMYWGLVVTFGPTKVIQAACAPRLAGPWQLVRQPILTPGDGDAIDGRHCDTPSAYWFGERGEVLIFYKAYPKLAEKEQPGAPFGSSVVTATWRPGEATARKGRAILRPGQRATWRAAGTAACSFSPARTGVVRAAQRQPHRPSRRQPSRASAVPGRLGDVFSGLAR